MRKWFYAIYMFMNHKNKISGYQLQQEIGVTYKTAWRMLNQIKNLVGNMEYKDYFDAVIETNKIIMDTKQIKENYRYTYNTN